MITPNTGIIIERVSNGFVVRPWGGNGSFISLDETLVFNDLGYASQARDYGGNTSLTVFITSHFSEPTPEPKP